MVIIWAFQNFHFGYLLHGCRSRNGSLCEDLFGSVLVLDEENFTYGKLVDGSLEVAPLLVLNLCGGNTKYFGFDVLRIAQNDEVLRPCYAAGSCKQA